MVYLGSQPCLDMTQTGLLLRDLDYLNHSEKDWKGGLRSPAQSGFLTLVCDSVLLRSKP